VVDTQILTQLVVVEHESGIKTAFNVDELELISSSAAKRKQDSTGDDTEVDEAKNAEQ
jgi:hypothetical protein